MKILIMITIGMLILGIFTMVLMGNKNKLIEEGKKLYQGPVPKDYDEKYFRDTGITRKLK